MRDIRKDLEERLTEIDARYAEEIHAHQIEREALDERLRTFLGYLDRMRGAINQVLMMEQKRELLEHRDSDVAPGTTSFPLVHEVAAPEAAPAPVEEPPAPEIASAAEVPEPARSHDAEPPPRIATADDIAAAKEPPAQTEAPAEPQSKIPAAEKPAPSREPIVTRKLVPLSDFLVTKAKAPGK